MIAYYVRRDQGTSRVDTIDPAWLDPESGLVIWADVQQPTAADAAVLETVFRFHPLAVEDALQTVHVPKVEAYEQLLYLVLHGIDFQAEEHAFVTQDVDFFLGPNFLVTVHDGQRRSVAEIADGASRRDVLREGPVALLHRIVDSMVDHYRPEVDEVEDRLNQIEERVLEAPGTNLIGEILSTKRDISSMRRVVIPQRDIVGRLARREFPQVSQEMAYRFRDVYDQLVRLADEANVFQDRVTGILDAHLAAVSNRLATVSKVLTGIAVIFGPLTVVTGIFGMNVDLPAFPGGEAAQFWWIAGIMLAFTTAAYGLFHHWGWL